jgi:glycine betaine/proline transport system substrate-binding protein
MIKALITKDLIIHQSIMIKGRDQMKRILALMLTSVFILGLVLPAMAKDKVIFSVPPWPGVRVKSEVATQILETIGYQVEHKELSPPITYTSMPNGDVDVCLASWMPQQKPMLQPKLDEGTIKVAATNLDEAAISLCVPDYVYEKGITRISDLDKNAEKFKHIIYNIEVGAGMQQSLAEMIEKDVAGLGDWKQMNSATPLMLSSVKGMAQDGDWVVFGCWKPHWMTVEMDMSFLEGDSPGSEILVSDSVVLTTVRQGFKEEYPNVHKFLEQFKVTSDMQSNWIHQYSYQKKKPENVSRKWISENLDIVAEWLEGVETAGGENAMEAVRKEFAK